MNAEAIFPYAAEAKHAVSCPVCHAAPQTVHQVHDRYGYLVPFAVCQDCTLGYLTEQMSRDGYARLYAGGYRALIAAISKRGPLIRTRSHTTVPVVRARVTQRVGVRPIRTILDAGGSTGSIGLAVAEQYGATLTVLDPATQELPATGSTIAGWLEDPIPGTYDLALLIATSEHLTDPLAAFTNLRRVARWLYLDFIDVGLRQRDGERFKTKIDHPLYWTAPAMRRALITAGWRIQKSCALGRLKPSAHYLVTDVVCEHDEMQNKES